MPAVWVAVAVPQYEKNLEALRLKRKEDRGITISGNYSDTSIVSTIHSLYTQALNKFKVCQLFSRAFPATAALQ